MAKFLKLLFEIFVIVIVATGIDYRAEEHVNIWPVINSWRKC